MEKSKTMTLARNIKLLTLPLTYLICIGTFFFGFGRENHPVLTTAGSSYLQVTYRILEEFQSSDDFFRKIDFWYQTRIWKGFAIPQLTLPFTWLMDENLRWGVFLSCLTSFCAFVLFSYGIFCHFLSSRRAGLATLFLVSTTLFFFSFILFDSYSYFLSGLTASFFFLLKSRHFKVAKYSILFGISIGLTAWVRPFEMITTFMIPLLIYHAYCAFQLKTISAQDLFVPFYLSVALAACILGIQNFSLNYPETLWVMGVFTIFCSIPVLFNKPLGLNFSPAVSWSLCFSVASFWWLPMMKYLYFWMFYASYGKGAHPKPEEMSVIDYFFSMHHRMDTKVFLLLLIVTGLSWCLQRPRNIDVNLFGKLLLPSVLYIGVVPYVLYAFSDSFNQWYFLSNALGVGIFALIVSLQKIGSFQLIRLAGIMALVASQFFHLYSDMNRPEFWGYIPVLKVSSQHQSIE